MNFRPTLGVASVLMLAGCAAIGTGPVSPPAQLPSGVVVATGHGWTSAGLDGPIPAAGTCRMRTAANREPLPDPACTPGAVDQAVSDANIRTTVCRKGGYTSSIRPPETLTEPAKRKLLAAYGIPASDIGKYELDHLIELNAGGASDIRNLWPEINTDAGLFKRGTYVRNDKDAVEDYTFQAICAGKTTVSAVQAAIVSDWTTAVAKLGLPPIPAGYTG